MPNNKMERFTQRARRVLTLAQEEAERLHHNYIGTQHLLLGIMLEDHGIGARVLRDLEVEQHRVKELVVELSPNANTTATTAELSPGTKHLLELAVDEARRMGHHYIGTEHLLLGLVRQSEGVAIDVLKRLGVSPEEVRRQTRRVLQEAPVQPNVGISRPVSPAAVPDAPSQATKRLQADIYEMLENVLMKILEMIEADKLPIEKGVELFSTLTPDLKLAPGQQAQLISHLFDQKKFNDYNVHLTTLDAKGTQTFNHSGLPLTTVLAEIDRFLATVLNQPETSLIFTLGDNFLVVKIEKSADDANE